MSNLAPTPLRRAGLLALFAALYTYALIVFGGIVRITDSGMGCGDHWPKCNGEWIPAFTFETLIEYGHRLLAVTIGAVVLGVFLYAFVNRARPGFAGRSGVLRPLTAAMLLLVAQALLGAITVRLGLSTGVTATHFVTAQIFAATLLVTAARADVFGAGRVTGTAGGPDSAAGASRAARIAFASALFGILVIGMGALTANTAGAPQACAGFPLCNGRVAPFPSASTTHIHWTHRLLAFLFFFHLIGAYIVTIRAGAGSAVRNAAALTLGLVTLQLAVAAALVLAALPRSLQAAHLGIGVAIWFALVVWTALARRDVAAADASRARAPARARALDRQEARR